MGDDHSDDLASNLGDDSEVGLADDWPGQPLIAVFFIALEHPMAVPDGFGLTVTRLGEPVEWVQWNGGHNFVGIRLHRTPVTQTYQTALDDAAHAVVDRTLEREEPPRQENVEFGRVPVPEADILATVAEVATPLLPCDGGDFQPALSDAFDRCLEELRSLMRAYVTVTKDVRFRPISRQTCQPIVPWTTQGLDGAWGPLGLFMVHLGERVIPFAADELTDEQIHALQVTLERARKGDPFASYVERARVARRAHRIDGDYPTTVIAAYTACEVLLNTALLAMAWEEGMARDDTRGWFEGQGGFMARVQGQVVPRLGGRWTSGSPEDPLVLLRALSKSRNDVVHNGHLPEEREAATALDIVEAIEVFVKELLGAKRRTYPRTALLLLGRPGMERLGLRDRWMVNFMNNQAAQEPDWIATFTAWRSGAAGPFVPASSTP